jgi:hypothetical protein
MGCGRKMTMEAGLPMTLKILPNSFCKIRGKIRGKIHLRKEIKKTKELRRKTTRRKKLKILS